MFKKLLISFGMLGVLLVAIYFYGVVQNNRDVPEPQVEQMQQQLEQSIRWLVNNESDILLQANPMLWWMLYEVHKLSADERIAELLEKYHQRNSHIINSAWGPLFGGTLHRRLSAYSVQNLPYYNQHFIYALNCAADIEDESLLVAAQNNAHFCHQSDYFYRPACITHQLMGVNFLYTKQCDFLPNIDELSQALQQDIVSQLTWDIRVVDVYLQRVLMLLITGAEASVKPVWIQQVLDHQLGDGGWGDFVALLGDVNGRSIGFSSKLISLGREQSSFHATAQGAYILSYLLANK